uniref:DUF4806 domain-containing protein n=1 Tax=Caenorhabditis tropicalis TaxID=1561998 RepID=A0A1I7UMW6_9PELO
MYEQEEIHHMENNVVPIQNDYENNLNVLLMAVLREFNAPLEAVESPSIQKLIHHLNPNVTLPSVESMLHTVSEEDQNEENVCIEDTTSSNQDINNLHLPLDLTEIPCHLNIKNCPKEGSSLCIVCLKWQELCKVKRLREREASIFLFICVSENVHSIETARELYTSKITLKACISHNSAIVIAGLKHLRIRDVSEIPKVTEQTVADAFMIVKQIENNPLSDEQKVSTQKQMFGSFRQSLACFFKKYASIRFTPPSVQHTKVETSSSKPKSEPLHTSTYNNSEIIDFPEDFLEP